MEASNEAALNILKDLNQDHIYNEFQNRPKEQQDKLIKQIGELEKTYPGGLKEYVKRAKKLLEESKEGVNPYLDYKPSVPSGENVDIKDPNFHEFEALGLEEIQYTSFVLVAGGLGERLGYGGIKIGLPVVSIVPNLTYLEFYVQYLLAFEDRCRDRVQGEDAKKEFFVPLAIMTSDDTHQLTVDLLEKNNHFGTRKGQITIMKQEKVPALLDNNGKFSLTADFEIETKPHGHGDVHTLLHQYGLIDQWVKANKKWVVFFQDTNALVFKCIPSAIAVSSKNNYAVNSITVSRKPGEAVGAICTLTHEKDGSQITINVEYNQLDSLLRSKFDKDGDVPDAKGLSKFPGNTNMLIFQLKTYSETLNETKGLVPEFVNPKYADASKTNFKAPTRLECMMQDFPRLLGKDAKVGFTTFDRTFCFSGVKNNLKDAAAKFAANLSAESASSAEYDMYAVNNRILRHVGVDVEEAKGDLVDYGGIKLLFGPKIFWYPSFGVTVKEIGSKFSGSNTISQRSTLVLKGRNTYIKDLHLDSSAVIEGKNQEKTEFTGEHKDQNYVTFTPVDEKDEEAWQIRGYKAHNLNLKALCI